VVAARYGLMFRHPGAAGHRMKTRESRGESVKNEKKNSDNNKNKRRQSLKSVSFERLVG
jgi:hypothetical protein